MPVQTYVRIKLEYLVEIKLSQNQMKSFRSVPILHEKVKDPMRSNLNIHLFTWL